MYKARKSLERKSDKMGTKDLRKYEWKYDNDASRTLSRLAKSLGILPNPGWKSALAVEVGQGKTPNKLSQWVERGNIPSDAVKRIIQIVTEKGLPNVFLEEEGRRVYLSGEAVDRWPFLAEVIEGWNRAAEKGDPNLAFHLAQYATSTMGKQISWAHEEEARQFEPNSEERAVFIYQKAAEDLGVTQLNWFRTETLRGAEPSGWSEYLKGETTDAELYHRARNEIAQLLNFFM